MRYRPFLKLAAAVLAVLLLPGWLFQQDTLARHDANVFIVQTLSKQSGKVWDRLGQFVFFSYDFDSEGCTFTATRHAEFAEDYQQIIPLSRAKPVGLTDSEIVFDCEGGGQCVTHQVRNLVSLDDVKAARTRLLAMDPTDLEPVANAFTELHRLCSDPYGRPEPAVPCESRAAAGCNTR